MTTKKNLPLERSQSNTSLNVLLNQPGSSSNMLSLSHVPPLSSSNPIPYSSSNELHSTAHTSSIKPSTLSSEIGSSEAYYKSQVEKLSKDNKLLKQKLDGMEKENRNLKKSLYELTVRYDLVCQEKQAKPFNLDNIEEVEMDETDTEGSFDSMLEGKDFEQRVKLKEENPRQFYCKYTFKGHTAATCTTQFSPCGKFLGSGSFDKSVRLWNLTSKTEMLCLQEHSLNVSDLSWSNDSSELLSGGYDQKVKAWDINKGKLISSHSISGFVQAVSFNPTDNNLFFTGSTHKQMILTDRRKPEAAVLFDNDSMVNTLYVYRNSQYVLSGDGNGFIKLWDIRTGKFIFSYGLEGEGLSSPVSSSHNKRAPISHLHVSRGARPDEEGQYLSVNSYDNVLRIYDRVAPSLVNAQPENQMNLLYSLTGHKNKNWPIKSAFFMGKNWTNALSSEKEEDSNSKPADLQSSFIIATGSADMAAYVFDLGNGASKKNGTLLQKLKGHGDRVYCVHFHPVDPILATCSGKEVKIWSN
eukprot:TRINITY_DN7171_c0_g1_i1.p1 TRINITY_DN7171_c0_g1~~TRINITY_DN7171_c0_g1_i1.p1  ORF type:complete len:525 (-),score=115.98 TRINITY_DN7171_c0_g1_i1:236-1810(-)